MNVIDIIPGTSVDGPGLRTSIYFAGCSHHCPGCHNPQSWDADGGTAMSIEQILDAVEENGFNVTLTGGDPLFQIDDMVELASRIKKLGYTVWCYTGYTIEQIQSSPRLSPILNVIDALVDGPFMIEKRETSLRFRGSSNQRIIHLVNGKVDKCDDASMTARPL